MDKRSIFFVLLLGLSFFLVQHWMDEKKAPQPIPQPTSHFVENQDVSRHVSDVHSGEKFYVLENDYVQLVFSNYGGALVEINLPFPSTSNKKSVVQPIEFDRIFKERYPENAHFPLQKAFFASHPKEEKEGSLGGYYPLLRRSFMGPDNKIIQALSPSFYALSLFNGEKELESLIFEVSYFDSSKIEFTAKQSQRRITKTFTLPNKDIPYSFDVSIQIEGDNKNFWMSTGIPEVELSSGSFSPILKYHMMRGDKNSTEKLDLPKKETIIRSINPNWVSNSNGFFGLLLDPINFSAAGLKTEHIDGKDVSTRLSLIDPNYQLYPNKDYPGYDLFLPLPSVSEHMNFHVFAGPFQNKILTIVDQIYQNPKTGSSPDFIGAQSYHGWFSFISEPFAKFLFLLMDFFHKITGSWGFSIILLTIALRIMLYPLNAWSIKSMGKVQKLAPQVQAIQAKHKKDPKKAQIEIMQLYRNKGANPFIGCFPLLIQMPFLIGMFDLLKSTFELRGASFIPGWIENLTSPDILFSWSFPIFFIGTQFHLLPLLLGAVMYIQQKISTTLPKDKSLWTDQQKQQQVMGLIMPIVFTVMFYHFPSGLNIYWLSSMLLGILQQWWTMKSLDQKKKGSV